MKRLRDEETKRLIDFANCLFANFVLHSFSEGGLPFANCPLPTLPSVAQAKEDCQLCNYEWGAEEMET